MRHFLQLDPNSTTLYFKDHSASIKDNSTMKNATGFRFEKKGASDNSGQKKSTYDDRSYQRGYEERSHHRGSGKYERDNNSSNYDGEKDAALYTFTKPRKLYN